MAVGARFIIGFIKMTKLFLKKSDIFLDTCFPQVVSIKERLPNYYLFVREVERQGSVHAIKYPE